MSDKSITLDPRIIGGLRSVLMLRTVGYAADHLITFQDLGTDPSDHLFRIAEVKCGGV